ncbi:phosphoenolpyruvate--protein phosphotransferase [Acidobacteria bacterium AH-259-D05]|nr:phosphoenolpyruvate--protein phosphotransferase [Acidobacteria bacterium AH-259-D05]
MTKDDSSQELAGIGLSPGVAIGTACEVEPQTIVFYRTRIAAKEVSKELKRFRAALEKSRQQLEHLRRKFEAELGKEHTYIIDAHLLILDDFQLLEEIENKVQEERYSPERAVRETAEKWLSVYRSLDDPFFRERGSDVEEVIERIIANLMKLSSRNQDGLPEELILIVPEVSLFLLAEYPIEQVKGLVVRRGGPTSHGVIIARSYQIPVVSGIQNIKEVVRTGDTLIVDGVTGIVRVRPSGREIKSCKAQIRKEEKRRLTLVGDSSPCVTADGRRIFVYANAEIYSEVSAGLRLGGEGIGLFRSEYLYMKEKKGPASEEQQFRIYKRLAKAVKDRSAVIRTLDLGNERHPYFSAILGDEESALGLRGIRMSLRHPEIYREQIRAILRASAFGNLKIVLPMVSSVEEVAEARRLIQSAQKELLGEGVAIDEGIEIGVMIEVPAAVIMLEALCAHADFFAVGTNDLIQYTLAAGRSEDRLAHLFNPLHPAVLKSLYHMAQVVAKQDSMVLVCGEIAAHPIYATLLVGMGFQHLSMNAIAIPEIKQRLREISYLESREVLTEVLKLVTLEEIEAFVSQHITHVRLLPKKTRKSQK